MIDIYRQSLKALRQFWLFILLYAALIEGLPMLSDGIFLGIVAPLLLHFSFAYAVHRYVLFGEAMTWVMPAATTRPHRVGRFLVVSLAVLVVVVGLAIIVAENLRGFLAPLGRASLLALGMTANLFVLSAFGTVLPAAAADEPLLPSFSLMRFRNVFWQIFGGLLAGPAVVGSLGMVAVLLVGRHMGPSSSVAATFLYGAAASALAMVNTTFAVVVLCRAYRRVVPLEHAIT